MSEFNLFIKNMDCLDVPMVRRKYMWYRSNSEAKLGLDKGSFVSKLVGGLAT